MESCNVPCHQSWHTAVDILMKSCHIQQKPVHKKLFREKLFHSACLLLLKGQTLSKIFLADFREYFLQLGNSLFVSASFALTAASAHKVTQSSFTRLHFTDKGPLLGPRPPSGTAEAATAAFSCKNLGSEAISADLWQTTAALGVTSKPLFDFVHKKDLLVRKKNAFGLKATRAMELVLSILRFVFLTLK